MRWRMGGTDTPILQGLISAADSHDGFSSESYSYLKNGLWWAGMLTSECDRRRKHCCLGPGKLTSLGSPRLGFAQWLSVKVSVFCAPVCLRG